MRGGETGARQAFRWRRAVGIGIAVAGLLLVTVLVWLGSRLLIVREELTHAQSAVAAMRSGGDISDNLEVLATSGARAARAASDPVWGAAEHLPWAGDNLRAVRLSAEALDTISNDVAVPLLAGMHSSAGVSAVIAPLQAARPEVVALSDELAAVPRDHLVSQVSDGLADVTAVMRLVRPAVEYVPGLLGADGAKNYLIVAQNNAELLALGGSAGTGTLIRVDNGKMTILKQASSQDYDYVRPLPDPLPKSLELLYGPVMKTHPNATVSRPDWPTAAVLAKELWNRDISPDRIDGVASLDPIALAGILKATGPVTMPDGEKLTSDNMVRIALNEAYLKYGDDTADHGDSYFAAIADSVFQHVAGGDFDPAEMLSAVQTGIANRSLMFWSADPAVEKVVATSRLGGVLPTTNRNQTSIGVFYRDHSLGTKIDYYLEPSATVTTSCRSDGTTAFVVTVNVSLPISRQQEAKLPHYVRGHLPGQRYDTEVFIYGPPKGRVESVEPTSESVVNRFSVKDLGRRVVKATISTTPGATGTVTATFTIPPRKQTLGPTQVLVTPTVHPTKITLAGQACQVPR